MNTDGFAKFDPSVFMNYLRADVAGPGHLATFMLHSGPKVEEMVTSVSFVHGEVARAVMKPSLLDTSQYPVDMVMVPDGDQETIEIMTNFLYRSANSGIIVSAAQADIVGNALSNLLGTPSSELLQVVVDSAAALPSTAVLTVELDAGQPEENIVVQDWQEEEVEQQEEEVEQQEEEVEQQQQEEEVVQQQEEEVQIETVEDVWVDTAESLHGQEQVGGGDQPQALRIEY